MSTKQAVSCQSDVEANKQREKNETKVDESDYEDEDDYEFKPQLPCHSCRKNRCSNCLVKFKKGQRKCNKIPSSNKAIGDSDHVSLEVALICVFDPVSPYLKWNKAMEMKASMKVEEEGNLKQVEKVEDKQEHSKLTVVEPDSAKETLQEAADDFKEKTSPIRDDDDLNKIVNIEELTTKMLAKIVWDERKILPDFYLCSGCAELLTVLYTVWEQLELNEIPVHLYFHIVMMGFTNAPKAQEVIYRPQKHVGSSMYALKVYGKKFHPHGCQKRTTGKGVKITLETNEGLIKNAVGNLHAFLYGAYCRVYNEIVKELKEDLLGFNSDDDFPS